MCINTCQSVKKKRSTVISPLHNWRSARTLSIPARLQDVVFTLNDAMAIVTMTPALMRSFNAHTQGVWHNSLSLFRRTTIREEVMVLFMLAAQYPFESG